MSAVISRPPAAPAAPPAGTWRSQRRRKGRTGRHRGAAAGRIERAPRRLVVLRCPGPLVALRCLAALYRVSEHQLAALLSPCETRAAAAPGPGALRNAVSAALGVPLTPVYAHYFLATWLQDPRRPLEHGIDGSPHGPRGCLVRDTLVRPAAYGTREPLAPAAPGRAPETTRCIVEYRTPPAPDGADVEIALRFVAAALRGGVSPLAIGAGAAVRIAARDIVSVRELATQTEWTHAQP